MSPAPMFKSNIVIGASVNIVFRYDVSADGKRFAVVTNGTGNASASSTLAVVVNAKQTATFR